MSRTNHRTWQNHRIGYFLLTVHLDPPSEAGSREKHPKLADFVRHTIELADEHQLPVTWAVSDPAYSAATPLVLRSATCHELAILGDANWVGPTAGRTRFARELARRVSQARSARINVTTLVPRVGSIDRHIDLVIKQRISAIAGVKEASSANRPMALPRARHYGVWEIPVSGSLPLRSHWWFCGKRFVLRQIRTAAHAAAVFHLVVDAPAMVQEGRGATATLAWFVRRVAELRDRGLIGVETLGETAARLSAVPSATPQHSILRRAA
ncbi:MAG TPA: hypothetical protein VHK01_21730 [Lacipirellulaceae bacterium]|nr:hypothetical protein [Lacipirellulaceae bacterium]